MSSEYVLTHPKMGGGIQCMLLCIINEVLLWDI